MNDSPDKVDTRRRLLRMLHEDDYDNDDDDDSDASVDTGDSNPSTHQYHMLSTHLINTSCVQRIVLI